MTINDFSKALNIRWWSHYDETIKRLVKARGQLSKIKEPSYTVATWIAQINDHIDVRIDAFQTGKIQCSMPPEWVPMFKEKNLIPHKNWCANQNPLSPVNNGADCDCNKENK